MAEWVVWLWALPLAPVLSDLFIGHHKKLWLESFQDSGVLFCWGCVGGAFCLFCSGDQALLFFNYIDSGRPDVGFAVEGGIDHGIPFLDVFINNDTHFPVTSVYCKKTFTGLLTNYFSFTSHSYKLGLIRMLVDSTYKINNTWLGLYDDITKLTKILQKNLFPVHVFENIINHYLTLTRQDCNSPASVSDTILHVPFTLNYLTLVLSLLSRRKRFATLLNTIVITLILS